MKRRGRFFRLLLLLVMLTVAALWMGAVSLGIVRLREPSKTDEAIFKAHVILVACEEYRSRNGVYPPSLDVLVNPPDGGEPYLKDKNGVIDPWGGWFVYGIMNQGDGKIDLEIYSEVVIDGRMKWIGAKLTAEGQYSPMVRDVFCKLWR